MKTKIYVDTSVIGGCLDEEFEKYSNKFLLNSNVEEFIFVLSDITLLELEKAPEKVKNIINKIPKHKLELVYLDKKSIELSNKYLKEKILTKRYLEDMQHIAIATVVKVNLLVSWNFKHIVNLKKIREFNAVNLKNDYGVLEIRSPREVVSYEE